MAKSIATVGGVALAPGVSLNGRMYTRPAIAKMVARAQERIRSGGMPLTTLTHHAASDDSSRIVGQVTGMSLDEDGAARFTASIADTEHGRAIASLVDTSDGQPAFLKNVSIRGWWAGTVRKVKGPDGEPVETADDLELDGLDYTKSPGVARAGLDTFAWADRTGRTETTERVPLTESVREARVTITDEAVPVPVPDEADLTERMDALRDTFGLVEHVLEDGFCTTCGVAEGGDAPGDGSKPYGNVSYADPGYQADKKKRYPLDSKSHAKSAWSYVNQKANAAKYTANQLQRIKSRILAALKKFGVKASSSESWASGKIALTEHYGDDGGSFSVSLNNGALCVTVSSYCVDPCDLDVIGTAAMNAACLALGAMDPDMDGDIDVDGADSEDDDADNGDQVKYTPPLDRETAPDGGDVTEATPEDPAPEPAAEPHTETEVPAMADTDKPAVEATPAAAQTEAAPAAPQMVAFTTEQFAQLMASRVPASEAAPSPEASPAAPAVAETDDARIAALVAAGVAEAVKGLIPAPAEPVAETLEQKVARLVEAGVTEAKQALVASGAVDLSRKGVVRMATETAAGGGLQFNEHGQPSTWPNKPLHEYSSDELAQHAGPVLDHWIMKGRAVTSLD